MSLKCTRDARGSGVSQHRLSTTVTFNMTNTDVTIELLHERVLYFSAPLRSRPLISFEAA
jgi:hypothetical protein